MIAVSINAVSPSWLQVAIGLVITFSAWLLVAHGMDGLTSLRRKVPLFGLALWGVLFALAGVGRPDSLSANAMAALVAYVLVRHGRQVRGILEGDVWWPPNALCAGVELAVTRPPRREPRPWRQKLNLLWAFFGNDDDGPYGDPDWLAGRARSWRVALQWWLRNPCHNLTWYVIGVADRERVVVGRWSPEIHPPGGGLLFCVTLVVVRGCVLRLPFVSYLSPYIKAYAGWRPGGAFGFKLNLSPRGSISLEA